MLRFQPVTVLALTLAVSTASAASNKVCMGGNVEQLSATQAQACQQTAQQVRAAADKSGTSNWHFVVVCDEAGWQDYAAFATMPASDLQQAAIDNNLAQRTSFVRASRVGGAENTAFLASEMASLARRAQGHT